MCIFDFQKIFQMKLKLTLIALCVGFFSKAQDYHPKNDGVKTNASNYTAISNAKIYVSDSKIIDKGTLLIRNGLVVESGKNINFPSNTVVINAIIFQCLTLLNNQQTISFHWTFIVKFRQRL